MIENSVDQHHLKWLHRTSTTPTWDDGEINPQPFDYGIVNTYTRRVDGKKWAHVNYFVFPTMNKTGNVEEGHPTEHRASSAGEVMRWRVPVDDACSMHFTVEFGAARDGEPVKIMEDRSEQGIVDTKQGVYRWDDSIGWLARADQDRAAQESQGTIYDRSTEHLGATDKGVILLRRLYRESIEAVQKGRDPIGVVRDPAKNEILRLVPHEDLPDYAEFEEDPVPLSPRIFAARAGALRCPRRDHRRDRHRGEKRRRVQLHRPRADLRRQEGDGGDRGGLQQEIRLEGAHQLRRRAGHERDGGARHHRGKERQQIVHRFLSRVAIALRAAAPAERAGESRLVRDVPLDQERDGDLSARGRAGLYVAPRHELQLDSHPERQSAEAL